MRLIRILTVAAAALAVAAAPAGARGLDTKLSIVAYSTPGPAYADLISAYQKTPAGKDVSFSQSYGASGEQTRAVLAGQKADFVHLSLWPDMSNLVKNGLVDRSWGSNNYRGTLTRSVVVFVLRDGNPKKVKTWNDLIKPGVEVLTPNPFTSGGAKWNIIAAYGSQLKQGKTAKQAEQFVRTLFHHVPVQDSSARNSLKTFLSGKGDVLLTYENEAILAQKQGQKVQYVIPKATLRIDNPAAVTRSAPPEGKAWLKWLYTAPAQKIFASWGYRPVLKPAAKGFNFPSRPDLFTIDSLGGWAKVDPYWFDPKKGLMVSIERDVGGSTG